MEKLDHIRQNTALIVIDLQQGIVQLNGAPHSGKAVVTNAARLVQAFRASKQFIAFVHVASKDGQDMLHPKVDVPSPLASGPRPANWAEFVPELGVSASDHVVTKHNWGAFHGTDLDLQLRRRGIQNIVLCGIATGYGVDMTAREAYQHGYNQVFVTDAMTGLSLEEHEYVHKFIFPRMGQIRTTDEVLATFR